MEELAGNLPKRISNWKADAVDAVFDRETIFDHINGGAELYLAYDFRQVRVRKYIGDGEDEIVLDIYDMGSGPDAFGVFSSECEYGTAGIGQGSEYSGGLLRFWQDRYFVSILAMGESPEIEAVILKLGNQVAGAITATGQEPMLLALLPAEAKDQRRVRFFHTPLVLSKHYYLADDNILELNRDTDCLLVEYPAGDNEPVFLLVVYYRKEALAHRAHRRFLNSYFSGAGGRGEIKTENGRWTMARLKGTRLLLIFDAPEKNQGLEILAKLNL